MRSPLPFARRVARGLERRLLPPVVSVVIPFYNVQEYLGDCITSLLRQNFARFELILVDDGSTDQSHVIAERLARSDRRVKLVTQQNSGPGAARNTGVARARGTYLSFVDSDDRLPPDALRLLVEAARRDRADVVVGAIRRFNSTRTWVPRWVKGVHSEPRRNVTLADFPELLRNNYPVGKVYRRDFWQAQDLPFREGSIYEDQPLIAQMLSRAKTITVLTDIVYDYRAREDRSSVSQRPEDIADLRDRVLAWRLSLEALQAESPREVIDGWYDTIYNTHLHWYLNNPSIADADYWHTLQESFEHLAKSEPPHVMERLSPEKRIAVELLRADRQDALVAFREAGGYDIERFPTTSSSSGLQHHLPIPPGFPALPPETFVSRPSQLELRQEVTGGRWIEGPAGLQLELTGFARIVNLDSSEPADVQFAATHRATGKTFEASVEPVTEAGGAAGGRPGYRAVLPLDALPHAGRTSTWDLAVRVTCGDLQVTEPLRSLSARSGFIEAPSHRVGAGQIIRLASNANRHVPLRLVLSEPRIIADTVALHDRTLHVAFRTTTGLRPARLTLTAAGGRRVSARVKGAGDGWQANVRLPEPAPGDGGLRVPWTVRAEDRIGRAHALTWTNTTGQETDVAVQNLLATGSMAADLVVEEFPQGYILLTAVAPEAGGKLKAAGTVFAPSGSHAIQLDAGPTNAGITAQTTHHGNHIVTNFLADASRITEEVTVTVTGTAQDADGGSRTLPVVVAHTALPSLPAPVPASPITGERGKERTLRLRLTPAPEGTPA